MLEWITRTIETLSYPGVVMLMFLENLFPPVPSEVIMPLAGYTATQGNLSLVGVIIAGTVGSVLGSLPLYYLGRRLGAERVISWADEHGKWLTVSGEEVERAKQWFDRHGSKAVFFCRLVPGVRSLIAIPAGIDAMPLVPFLLYTTLGSGLWTSLLTGAGYWLGENYHRVGDLLGPISRIVAGVLVLAGIVWVLKRRSAAHRSRQWER
jgi:membrane protein DedA with SNARE-associated domain